jgi:hypothetical protein
MTIFYHRTTDECAGLILRDGFRDGTGTYMTDQLWTGVWLSNVPLDENEGARGDVLLRVELPSEEMVAEYEWIQDIGYREWLIPAALINAEGRVTEVDEDEEDELIAGRSQGSAFGQWLAQNQSREGD